MPNRLANASSAYLRSAAHQPIDWYEFGEEAFERARELDRPILLDIGAVWCHWCHVIDRESYDNAEIAEIINRHYVAIKVDRDQRPDVDARYQQVVQALTGHGGWPLTAFITYDGRLIYGGTYFPPAQMKHLLNQIHQVYKEKKNEIFSQGEVLNEDTIRRMEQEQLRQSWQGQRFDAEEVQKLCIAFEEAVIDTTFKSYDDKNGGFGNQPKFPHFSALELLIAREFRKPYPELREMLEKTLAHMARGGIYDQIAGGFHRYSVDDHWHVPHFEKMAYDNAEALKVYAQAYRLTGIDFFREVAEGIIGWVREWLSDPEHGGFYASQDADIDLNDDGDHFTWTLKEVNALLEPAEAEVAIRYYDIHPDGDMHHAPDRNVLHVSHSLAEVARGLSLSYDDAERLLASAREKMMAQRRQRPIPFIDKTLYVNWNGMMLTAWFEAADLLDNPDWRDFSRRSLDRILHEFYRPGDGVEHATGVTGFLDDYAWLAQACLKGYFSTGETRYRQVAVDIVDRALEKFEDALTGGFYDTEENDQALGLLKFRRKPTEDSPSSSANAIMLQVLGTLHWMTGDTRYAESLERGLVFLVNHYGRLGLYVSALAVAAVRYAHPPLKIELLGEPADLIQEARRLFYPGKIITYAPAEGESEARICEGTRCLAPVRTLAEFREHIRPLIGHPSPQP